MYTRRPPFPEFKHLFDFVQGKSTFPPSSVVAQDTISHPAIGFMASLLRPSSKNQTPASEAQSHSWLLINDRNQSVSTFLPSKPQKMPTLHATSKQVIKARRDSLPRPTRKLDPEALIKNARRRLPPCTQRYGTNYPKQLFPTDLRYLTKPAFRGDSRSISIRGWGWRVWADFSATIERSKPHTGRWFQKKKNPYI